MPTIQHNEIIEQSRAILEELKLLGIEQIPKSDGLAQPLCPTSGSLDDIGETQTRCRRETLDEVFADLGECTRCQLSTSRKNIVFGTGNPNAEVLLVAESPSHDEDLQGKPFVGESGKLLDRILFAMGLHREAIYIANIVKCRPAPNCDPSPADISTCFNLFERQINAINPKIIIIFGEVAIQTLLKDNSPIDRIRGHWQEYRGSAVMPTYHPAHLLANPASKRDVWEDMKQVIYRLHNDD